VGRLNGRVKRLEDLAGTCTRCSGVVLCIDTDGKPMSARQWQEYEAGCPVCGRRPPTIRVVWDEEQE
jgi:uncharacterized protein (UPF0276 family)